MGSLFTKQTYDYSSEDDFSDDDDEEEENESSDEASYDGHQPFEDTMENLKLDSASDALDAAPHVSTMTITLNLDQVMEVERHLDVYEKVSLVYLLYDDPDAALEHLSKLTNGTDNKLIYNWAIQQSLKNLKWHEILVESLCIIENYEILRWLGLRREDLAVRFLAHHHFTSVNVNKIRKSLYFLCNNFDSKDVQKLLGFVCTDFQAKGFKFQVYDPQYLELYLLYWETMGYVKQTDLSSLCCVLKQMDQLDWYDKLKQLIPTVVPKKRIPKEMKTVDSKQSKSRYDEILDPSASVLTLTSMESQVSADNAPFVSAENKYDIDPNNPGVCLIINQENFYREIDPKLQHLLPSADNKLESRTGTQQDREKLEDTFKTFGFRVVTQENLIHSEISVKIVEVMQSITDESSFFLCIMSHGDEGVIYGVNSCRVSIKAIKNLMCSRNRTHLSGKPKVLILQSCQGKICQKISATEFYDDDDDIETDGPTCSIPEIVPPRADLFTFWATVPGFGAIRNKKTGSWFIQSLCENMKKLNAMHHFEDICTAVVKDVSSKKWSQTREDVAMVPLKDSTFRKLLYLPQLEANR